MAHKHEEAIPVPLETLVTRLGELAVVLGPQVRPTLAAVRERLLAAQAARQRGDAAAALNLMAAAIDSLTALAGELDPAEAVLMRAVAESFRAALARGDTAEARQRAAVMFERSGAVGRSKP
jgi:hypothetical protein